MGNLVTIGNVIGTRAPRPAGVMPPAYTSGDSEGRAYSIMQRGRVAQCQRCLDVGSYRMADLPITHPDFGKAIRCPDCNGGDRHADIADLLRRAHVPESKRGLTLASWGARFGAAGDGYHRAMVSFAASGQSRSGQRGLYIHGQTGRGKTGAAVAVLADLLPRAVGGARYLVWSEFLDLIRASWRTESQMTVAEAIADVNRATVLVVDEFGGSGTGEGNPEWRADVARRLADARHDAAIRGFITIWTSQLDLDGITREFGGEPIGAAVASRIMGHCSIVELGGGDARDRGRV